MTKKGKLTEERRRLIRQKGRNYRLAQRVATIRVKLNAAYILLAEMEGAFSQEPDRRERAEIGHQIRELEDQITTWELEIS